MTALLTEAPFRVRAVSAAAAEPPDPYFARLVKLVPSEVLALFVTFKQAATGFLGVWSLICLGLVIVVRTIGTRQAGKPIQWLAVAVAAISFALWVYATGGYLEGLKLPDAPSNAQAGLSIAIGVWTFVVPYFYKGDGV
jgi:hypothetical protein